MPVSTCLTNRRVPGRAPRFVRPATYGGRMTLDIPRLDGRFQVVSEFQPSGDQPQAIDGLEKRVKSGERHVVLLGATGTGKSATTAWLIERVQRPTLILAPNKTLCAQLAKEFRELMPHNAVEYFVSYYDYYQPEAYIAQTDTYIEKDSSVNEEVEQLRHSATMSLLTRRDVVVVATGCCAGWSTSSTPATTWRSSAARSGCAGTRWRSSRRTRSWPYGWRCSVTRWSGSTICTR